MSDTEDQLSAMLRSDAEQIRPGDLRPAHAFPPPRARRTGWPATTAATLAAAVATVAVLVAVLPLRQPTATPTVPPASAQSRTAALEVTFGTRSITVTPPGVALSIPYPEVRAADPVAAERVSTALHEILDAEVDVVRNYAGERVRVGGDAADVGARIAVGDTAAWHHFWSVRFDRSMTLDGPHPTNESVAATFDTVTGARVLSTDLFTDVTRATDTVRTALLASRSDGSLAGYSLAQISLRPAQDGSTPMINCYPTAAGLSCAVDQGSLAPYAAGRIETTVAWVDLAPLLRSGVTG